MEKLLYMSIFNRVTHECQFRYLYLSKSLISFLGLDVGSYISFAQDTKDSKQLYVIPGEVKKGFGNRICIHSNYSNYSNYMVYNRPLIRMMCDAFGYSEDYILKFLVARKPKIIDGIKVYPIIQSDYKYRPIKKVPHEKNI